MVSRRRSVPCILLLSALVAPGCSASNTPEPRARPPAADTGPTASRSERVMASAPIAENSEGMDSSTLPKKRTTVGSAPTKPCWTKGKPLTKRDVLRFAVSDGDGGLSHGQLAQFGGTEEWHATHLEVEGNVGDDVDLSYQAQVIDESGAHEGNVLVGRRFADGVSAWLEPKPATSEFSLVTAECIPPTGVQLQRRRLDTPTAGATAAAEWTSRQEGVPMKAVGEVRGQFGGGVDRLVVVGPKVPVLYPPSIEDVPEDEFEQRSSDYFCQAEFVVTMKGERVSGTIAVQRHAGTKAKKTCEKKDSAGVWSRVGLAGVVDLNADGIDEVLWTWAMGGEGMGHPQQLSISWFTGKRFETQVLASYTYTGSEAFIDPAKCGRSRTKWFTEDDPCAMEPR